MYLQVFLRELYGRSTTLACSGLSRLVLEGCSEDSEKLDFIAEFSNPKKSKKI